HFHAEYQGKKAMFSVVTGKKIKGEFPVKQEALVVAWAILRKKELMKAWKCVISECEPGKVEPLK
ncbi:MAG TPA: DUF4160 domain-containing protein, partial [Chlamydiales bacterium]|nr:DUF4160 domain-containing protein [Chlamydiales bacterium]